MRKAFRPPGSIGAQSTSQPASARTLRPSRAIVAVPTSNGTSSQSPDARGPAATLCCSLFDPTPSLPSLPRAGRLVSEMCNGCASGLGSGMNSCGVHSALSGGCSALGVAQPPFSPFSRC